MEITLTNHGRACFGGHYKPPLRDHPGLRDTVPYWLQFLKAAGAFSRDGVFARRAGLCEDCLRPFWPFMFQPPGGDALLEAGPWTDRCDEPPYDTCLVCHFIAHADYTNCESAIEVAVDQCQDKMRTWAEKALDIYHDASEPDVATLMHLATLPDVICSVADVVFEDRVVFGLIKFGLTTRRRVGELALVLAQRIIAAIESARSADETSIDEFATRDGWQPKEQR